MPRTVLNESIRGAIVELLQGDPGPQGEQGPAGPQGEKGDKGDPYVLTQADTETIIQAVLAALPSAEEVSY